MGAKSKFSDEERKEMARLYEEEKKTAQEVARLFGCTDTTVSINLLRIGVHTRGRKEAAEMRLNRSNTRGNVLELLGLGIKQAEIARMLGISRQAVYQHKTLERDKTR